MAYGHEHQSAYGVWHMAYGPEQAYGGWHMAYGQNDLGKIMDGEGEQMGFRFEQLEIWNLAIEFASHAEAKILAKMLTRFQETPVPSRWNRT